MADYIDREELIKAIVNDEWLLSTYGTADRLEETIEKINSMPTVEQKHGHWKDLNDCDEIYGDLYKCPFCENVIVSYGIGVKPDNYCGNCGAKMDEVTE